MSREIDEIKEAAGDYRKWALEARKKYIDLCSLRGVRGFGLPGV